MFNSKQNSSLDNSPSSITIISADALIKGDIENQSLSKGDVVLFASVGAGMNINAFVYQM